MRLLTLDLINSFPLLHGSIVLTEYLEADELLIILGVVPLLLAENCAVNPEAVIISTKHEIILQWFGT